MYCKTPVWRDEAFGFALQDTNSDISTAAGHLATNHPVSLSQGLCHRDTRCAQVSFPQCLSPDAPRFQYRSTAGSLVLQAGIKKKRNDAVRCHILGGDCCLAALPSPPPFFSKEGSKERDAMERPAARMRGPSRGSGGGLAAVPLIKQQRR